MRRPISQEIRALFSFHRPALPDAKTQEARKRMRSYSPEQKAQVIAEWSTGVATKALAAKYRIPRSTVRSWTSGLGAPVVATETKERLDERVVSLALVAIGTIEAVLLHARNPTWLEKQNANDLAIFIGVTTDKTATILAALERGQDLQRERESISQPA